MTPELIFTILTSPAIGSIVSTLIGYIGACQTRAHEHERQIRELAVRVAIDNWRDSCKWAVDNGMKYIQPLDAYLLHAMEFVKAMDGSIRDEDGIRAFLKKSYTMNDAACEEMDKYNKRIRTEPAQNKVG